MAEDLILITKDFSKMWWMTLNATCYKTLPSFIDYLHKLLSLKEVLVTFKNDSSNLSQFLLPSMVLVLEKEPALCGKQILEKNIHRATGRETLL